jgi:hypothetical protein
VDTESLLNPAPCPECGYHERHHVSFRAPGDELVTIIGFWPIEEQRNNFHDDRWISRCHYRTVCNHAHWDLQIIETPEAAVIPPGVPVIGLEEPHQVPDSESPPPARVQELASFDHPQSATYILGNTEYQRPSAYFACDYLVGISMDDPESALESPFYGNQVAAMIWYDRRLKGL